MTAARLDIPGIIPQTTWEAVRLEVGQRPPGGLCERCGRRQATEAHHRVMRSHGGPDVPSNLAMLCLWCHKWAHAHPVRAQYEGWLVGEGIDFRAVSVVVVAWGMPMFLDDLYGYIPDTDRMIESAGLKP